MNATYDLIAIGGGSGGLAVAERAAQLGKRVAIVDDRPLGGTCVNAGCVPKKLMWYAAHLAHAVTDAPGFGVRVEPQGIDWQRLTSGRDEYVANVNRYWDGYVKELGIDWLPGRGRFVDTRTVEVDGNRYTADHVVIATGARPFVPPVPGADLGITSDGFFALDDQPQRVAVIGGGYIGVELSGLLRALGSEVTLLTMESRLLTPFDEMVSDTLTQELRAQGIDVHLDARVERLEQTGDGTAVVTTDGRRLTGYDTVIWASGRIPNSEGLNLTEAGPQPTGEGWVETDDYQNTSVPGIYAIGDVTGRTQLTPVAIAAGRRLAERLFADRPDARLEYRNIPSVVFSHPPIAKVGLSEERAREEHGDDVTVYESRFTPMRYALAAHQPQTAMKLICTGPEQRVIGIHMIGDGADEMIQGFAVAMSMGATKADLDRTVPVHPTSAEELVTMKQPVRAPASKKLSSAA